MSDGLFNLIRENLDLLKMVFGALATGTFSLFTMVIGWLWRRRKKQMKAMNTELRLLRTAIIDHSTAAAAEHGRIRDALMGQRAEIHLLKKDVEPLKAGMLALEGKIANQNETINRYVEKMGIVSGKLDAVFRFIDHNVRTIPKRGTDV